MSGRTLRGFDNGPKHPEIRQLLQGFHCKTGPIWAQPGSSARRHQRLFLNGGQWKLIAEYVEVETGKNDDRPELRKALHQAKVAGATLVIAKLDRLSRNLRFIAELQESKVKFVCADMPDATELTIHIFASLAQHERKVISERTKRALQAVKELEADPIKAQERRRVGKKPLGNPNGAAPLRRAEPIRRPW